MSDPHPARTIEAGARFHCPYCTYAMGPIGGTPTDTHGAFNAPVRCPECGRDVPEGSMLLVGAAMVEAIGPITTRRRLMMSLWSVVPLTYLMLFFGLRGLREITQGGAYLTSPMTYLRIASLGAVAVVAWSAWRRWSARDPDDPRAAVSWELQWMVSPGRVGVFDRTSAHTSPVRAGSSNRHLVKMERIEGSHGLAGWIQAEDIHWCRATVPKRLVRGEDGRPRSGVMLHLGIARRNSSGVRSGMGEIAICVDAGAADDQPGLDHRTAAQTDGDALARRVMEIACGRRFGVSGSEVRVAGDVHAMRPWPAPMRRIGWTLVGLWCVIGFPALLVGGALAMDGARWGRAGLWTIAATAAFTALLVTAYVAAVRRLRRKQAQRAEWIATHEGLRILLQAVALRGEASPVKESTVPADRIARIELGAAATRPRLKAVGTDGNVIAELSPDTSLDGSGRGLHEALSHVMRLPPVRAQPFQ